MNSTQASRSLWNDVVRKIKADKVALACFFIILTYFVVAALCAANILFPNHAVPNTSFAFQPPSGSHWFGTDLFGRDVLARASHGTVTSILVGLIGAGLSVLIGSTLGALAGFSGGWIDDVIVWFYSTLDTIPYILLLSALAFLLGSGLETLCIAIGLTSWVGLCRLMRAEFMRHRDREYVQSAVALGASKTRQIFIHILPNTLQIILINFSLTFVGAVKSEVILTYLGLGVEVGTPSWGMMINDAKQELVRGVWWNLTAATLFMFVLVLAFNLFNDSLRTALDPKFKSNR